MKKTIFSVAIICLVVLVSVVVYAGDYERQQRLRDPYSRKYYFGPDYQKSYVSYGAKGTASGLTASTRGGEKGGTSRVGALATNAFRADGRNPGRVSNVDPGMRGFSLVDAAINLKPVEDSVVIQNSRAVPISGIARLISSRDERPHASSIYAPIGRVYIRTFGLPVLENEVYEAWLVDEDSGYSLNLGVIDNSISSIGDLNFQIQRKLHLFDVIMVTVEPLLDTDPRPGEPVLIGEIDVRTRTKPSYVLGQVTAT